MRRRGCAYWVDVIGSGVLAFLLAILLTLPIAVIAARLTEGSWESSTLFGVCYYGFLLLLATKIFRWIRA